MAALLVHALLSFSAPKRRVEVLSPTNASALKAAFFSGAPWLVQCGSVADMAAAAGDGALGVHEVIELALPKLPPAAQVGLLDCAKKLPSGKNTISRFKLDTGVTPMLIFSANGEPPVQLTPSMLTKHGLGGALFASPRQQAAALAHLVRDKSEKTATQLTKSEHLHARCLKRKHCALVLFPKEPSGEAERTLKKLMGEFRSVTFGTINTARYEFSLAKHLPAPANPKQPQMVAFRSATVDAAPPANKKGKADKKPSKALSVGAKAHRGEFSIEALRTFLTALERETLDFTPLKKAPSLRWRKQASKSTSSSSSSSSSTSGGGRSGSSGSERRGAKKDQAASARAGRQQQQRGGKGDRGGGGGGGASDEVLRRQKMAEEEEEYMRSMFGDADAEGGDGEDEGGDGDDADGEEELDFDDEDDEQEEAGAESDDAEQEEEEEDPEAAGGGKEEL
jgi:hypothetical protein